MAARALLWIVLGLIIYDIIAEGNRLFGLAISPFPALGAAAVFYFLQEFMIRRWKPGKVPGEGDRKQGGKSPLMYYLLVWIIVAGLAVSLFAVWLGVLYKQIVENI